MLFATTLLSAAMISRAEATADSQPSAFTDLMSRLTGGAWDNSESATSDPTLGQRPPSMGGLNEPCYSGGRCDSGLHCHYWKSGSAWMGKCKQDQQPHGGEGEPCRDHTSHHHGRCNHGLECTRINLYPSGSTEICERIPTPPPAPQTGEAGGRCNQAYPYCNHDNLRAHWQHMLPSGEMCTCEYFLGETTSTDGTSQGTRLGARPPVMGVVGGPCRNGNTYEPPCNDGLYCRYTTDGSAVFGTCEYLRGGLNERCYENGQCDYGLAPSYDHLPGQALSYPVCMCRQSPGQPPLGQHVTKPVLGESAVDSNEDSRDNSNGYSGEDSDDDDSSPRTVGVVGPLVGVVAPKMGGLGEPCRNSESHKGPCDHGLYCELSYDGSAVFGTCVEGPANRRGGLNEDCYRDGTCDNGLSAVHDHLGGQALAYPVCKCRSSSRPLGASADDNIPFIPMMGASADDNIPFIPMMGASAGDNMSSTKLGASAGDHIPFIPMMGASADDHIPFIPMMGASADDNMSNTKLGMRAPEMGGEGQPCRNHNASEGPCNPGFKCHYTTDGSAIFGECRRKHFAEKGEPCGSSAGYDQPRNCEVGTYCKAEPLLGCTYGPCTTHICTEYWLGDTGTASAPALGDSVHVPYTR